MLIILTIGISGIVAFGLLDGSKHPFIVEWRDKLFLAAVLIACVSVFLDGRGFLRHHTTFVTLDSGSSATKYLEEFRARPFDKRQKAESPDGASKLELTLGPAWTPVIWQSCNTLSVVSSNGKRTIVFKATEADPGSGSSFSWSWSKDSRAVFVIGPYSALDCFGRSGNYNMIYTIEDGISWAVPESTTAVSRKQ